jgi:Mn2+/Fe2+ NRAMP family transporter
MENMAKNLALSRYLSLVGPGLLYAGAAIGVSHLVQSTRAGADFGFDLMWILFAANLLKFPFFEIGSRYVLATGKTLVEAYFEAGRWILILFFIVSVLSMFPIQAALTLVTAGLLNFVFDSSMSAAAMSTILVIITMFFFIAGKFQLLDKMIKIVIIILTLSTIVAVVGALNLHRAPVVETSPFDFLNKTHLLFLIAFIGWMPAPIDIVVWTSLWSQSKFDTLTEKPDLKSVLIEFRIGFFGTMFVAAAFLALGALVMHGTNTELSPNGALFAGQLIGMYTSTIGHWAYPIIAIAAVSTMLSTTITVTDVYPRTLSKSIKLLFADSPKIINFFNYVFWIIVLSTGVILLIWFSGSTMRYMVDFATSLSFVTAPVLAFLNYKVIMSPKIDAQFQPALYLRIWSWVGIIFLSAFTLFYLYWLIFI